MTKTESDIERDFHTMVTSSGIGAAIRGGVYRSEMRPADAKTEDLVIKFLAGKDGQVQTGIVILNIYVPDIPYGANGRMVADKARIAQLQAALRDLVDGDTSNEYLLSTEATPTTIAAEGIAQHIVCARIHFQRITI